MKIAHLADLHITERPSRADISLEGQALILGWIAGDINDQDCDLAVIAGDVFDRFDTTAEERALAADFFQLLRVPLVVIPGNHENAQDLALISRIPRGDDLPTIFTDQAFVSKMACVDAMIACLPWPRKAAVVKWLFAVSEKGVGHQDTIQGAKDALARVLTSFRASFAGFSGPKVLVAHAEVLDAELDGGQDSTGKVELGLSPADLDIGADYVALGHFHKRQHKPGTYCYCGAPRQMRFGDDAAKGYMIFDTEKRTLTPRDAPGRKLRTIEGKIQDGELVTITEHNGPPVDKDRGDVVRLVYDVAENERERVRKNVEKVTSANFPGCRVIIEPRVIAQTATRAAEIRAAKTPAEKLTAYHEAKKLPAPGAGLLAKLAQVETDA